MLTLLQCEKLFDYTMILQSQMKARAEEAQRLPRISQATRDAITAESLRRLRELERLSAALSAEITSLDKNKAKAEKDKPTKPRRRNPRKSQGATSQKGGKASCRSRAGRQSADQTASSEADGKRKGSRT